MIKVLFLAANPTNTSRLGLGSEYREIQSEARQGRHGHEFDFVVESALRVRDLQAALLRHKPTIVHFSGHGQGAGSISGGREFEPAEEEPSTVGILAEDDDGRAVPIPGHALANLFQIVGSIEGVVLCACHSAAQAEAIRPHVKFVVGMDRAILDESAIAFSSAFYGALAAGALVHTAFDLGKNAIEFKKLPDKDIPTLLVNDGADARHLSFTHHFMPNAPTSVLSRPDPILDRPSRPFDAQFEEQREDPFLLRVERVVALRHPKAQIRRQRAVAPLAGMLEVEVDDGFVEVQLVLALDMPISSELLTQIVAKIVQPRLAMDPALCTTLVHQGDIAPRALRDEATRFRIALKTFSAYQGLFDLSHYLEWQTARLESSFVYPPRIYVDPPATYEVSGVRELRRVDNALQFLWDLLASSEHRRFVLVLGEFGAGKTFLLRELARRMHVDKHPVWPVLVEMDKLEKRHDLPALLAAHFSQADVPGYNYKAFQYMLEEGRIALLFDGFDELADRVTYDNVTAHFDTVLSAAQGGFAKVVLSSRRQHFLSESQVKLELGRRAERLPGFHLALLRPFDELQIRQYLLNVLQDKHAADERYALIHEVKDLLGLSHNPRMLGFIADIDADKLREAKRKQGTITAAGLYEILLGQWLDFEYDRERRRSTLKGMSRRALERGVTVLAMSMWHAKQQMVEVDQIRGILTEAMRALGEPALDPDVVAHLFATGSLLVRDTEGRFSFVHRSVMEWLVAREAAQQLLFNEDPTALGADEMSPLMADFFHSLAGRHDAVDWARSKLIEHDKGIGGQNAKLVLARLGESLARINFAGMDLRGKDFSGEDLHGADLRGADLSGATLVGTDLSGANLSGANLTGASLMRANLSRAKLIGAHVNAADMRLARLVRADLSNGIGIELAAFFRTNLAGAVVPAAKAVALEDPLGAPVTLSNVAPMWSAPRVFCTCVAFDPTGDLLAAGFADGTIRIFDSWTGESLRVLAGHTNWVRSVAFGPDGQTLASGSSDRSVRLWDVSSGDTLELLEGHQNGVWGIAFGPDGRSLASGSYDHTIRLWDLVTGQCLRVLTGHLNGVASVAFAPDGHTLASGSSDRTVRLWDVDSGRCLRVLEGHSQEVWSVAFAPDGQSFASGSSDQTVRLWDIATDRCLRVFQGHTRGVRSVVFGPDGITIASSASDNTIRFWNVASGLTSSVLAEHTNGIWGIAFGPGRALASGSYDKTVRLWDVVSGRCSHIIEGHVNAALSVAIGANGGILAAGSYDKLVRLWDLASGQCTRILEGHANGVWEVAFAPDGKILASGSSDCSIRLWDLASGNYIRTLKGHKDRVWSVAFRGDGNVVASSSSDRTIRLWDVASGHTSAVLEGHRNRVLSVAFGPDGRTIVSGSSDHTVRLWEISSGRALTALVGHSDVVMSVAFSSDGENLASGSYDHSVRLWHVKSGRFRRALQGHIDVVSSVAFAPDGQILASGSSDKTVRLWDVDSGRCVRVLGGHTNWVMSVAFSPDGQLLASAAYDGTIRLWSVATGQCFAILYAASEGWVACTPDGRYKFGGDLGGSFWHVAGLCRFEVGEIDEVLPHLRMRDDDPFLSPLP